MLAPHGVNQLAQNKGVERILREAAAAGRSAGGSPVAVTVSATGRRLAVPLASGGFEAVDVLTSVRYEIPRPAGPPLHVRIDVEPSGAWRVTHDLPTGAWPAGTPLRGAR
jgi:hypothetical protein